MWKLILGFIVFAAAAMYKLTKGGDTDMGGEGAPLPVDVSVKHLLARIDGFSAHDNGAFVSHDGRAIPY